MNQQAMAKSGRWSRAGFSMLEILVAIAVIAILALISVYAFRSLLGSASTRNTRIVLENVAGFVAEYEANGGTIANLPALPASITPPVSLEDVTEGNPADRFGEVVAYTQSILQKLYAVAKNKDAVSRLPPAMLLSDDLPDNPPKTPYVIRSAKNTQTNKTRPDPAILVDGWNNPIIFVPSTGLRTRVNGNAVRIFSVDGRPFFASAGPDGRFGGPDKGGASAGDDNIYSCKTTVK